MDCYWDRIGEPRRVDILCWEIEKIDIDTIYYKFDNWLHDMKYYSVEDTSKIRFNATNIYPIKMMRQGTS